VETPEPNLMAGMAWLQSPYTIGLNHRHRLFGPVFSGRYKAPLVEGSGNGYLRTACDSVHLNPVRAHLLKTEERLLKLEGHLGEHPGGELPRASAEAKAERIMAEELERRGWQEAELLRRRKHDPDKLERGARLRRETTLPLKAIASRVHLGSSKAANAKLHRHRRGGSASGAGQVRLNL
jgi:hypothetical protein